MAGAGAGAAGRTGAAAAAGAMAGAYGNNGAAMAVTAVAGSRLTTALKPFIGSAVYSTMRRVPSASIKL